MNTNIGIGWPEALLLIPFIALMLWALIDVIRRPASQMRHLPKWAWILIVLFGNTLGQIVYLAVGRASAKTATPDEQATAPVANGDAVDRLYGTPGDTSR